MPFAFRVLASCVALLFLVAHLRTAQGQAQSVPLQWTAPGDDGVIGTASAYDLRWSLVPITTQNFLAATPVAGEPVPLASGNRQSFTATGLAPATRHYFAIRTADDRGNWSGISNVVQVTTGGQTVSIDPLPLTLALSAPWPNPARAAVRMTVSLPVAAEVVVQAFDMSGRLVQTLARGALPAGRTELRWVLDDRSGRMVSAGVYMILARLEGRTFTQRVTVIP